ncbi:50S ribosomal protein L23 [Candidatus Nitrosacidococcus tergens]|uniref:Large ribosomal subunit protein uL23 n=1 Tax=Candidatus Nitrosacidococcus tergens TaxID=553981 RepID=A0A7G1Q864_9GAMM|nr:50S ribosomal protein L23 [Candidatus Nitrosacidococcus tergens]CAB1274811.1 50S ribosomal subunit protein L23 [Candidatus Nitrosacidococcus tergens]
MNEEKLTKIILTPLLSEKSTFVAEKYNQIVFKVEKSSSKREIKSAIELLFSVKVSKIHTVLMKGKRKKFGRYIGYRGDWKKAYVSLRSGYSIDFTGV